jgi:transcriptional regulator with XRE-family HTH domain
VDNRLEELRTAAGLSRFALAIRLKPPVTERTIIRWEKLESQIPDERKIELAKIFGVEVDDLIRWHNG